MKGYYYCPKCQKDNLPTESKYDDYWTLSDERQVVEELDEFFYEKYPQFKKTYIY